MAMARLMGIKRMANPTPVRNARPSCWYNRYRDTATWEYEKLELTHWGRDKMDAISQTTLSNAFSFMNENVWILIKISLKFVPQGPINNFPALVQIMAWRRPGDKPLSEPMMVNLLTHICVTRHQCVNSLAPGSCGCKFSNSYQRKISSTLPSGECHKTWLMITIGSINGLVPSGNKPLSEAMVTKFYDAIWQHQASMS